MGTLIPKTDRLVKEAVKESVKSGAVNVIDTAINYRMQKAERSVGSAVKELIEEGLLHRDEIFVSTKNGYLTPDADLSIDFRTYVIENLVKPGKLNPDDIAGGAHCMSVSYLEDQLERSRKNLGLDCIDLMYLHNAAESQIPDIGIEEFLKRLSAAFEFYEEQRKKHQISFYGMATWTCFRAAANNSDHLNLEDVVKIAEEVGGDNHGFRFIQVPYNLAMTEALTVKGQKIGSELLTVLQAAARLKLGVFISVPLMHSQILGAPKVPKFEGLDTPAQRAIQFVRSTPGVLAPLVGQKQPEHVKDNLKTAQVPPLGVEQFSNMFLGN